MADVMRVCGMVRYDTACMFWRIGQVSRSRMHPMEWIRCALCDHVERAGASKIVIQHLAVPFAGVGCSDIGEIIDYSKVMNATSPSTSPFSPATVLPVC